MGRTGWGWRREGDGGEKGRVLCFAPPPGQPCRGRGGGQRGPFALTVLSLPQEASLLALKQNQQWIFLETLAPDTPYELQVRVRAQRGSLLTWSPWSQPLAFRTRPEDQPLAGRRPDGKVELDRKGCGSWDSW